MTERYRHNSTFKVNPSSPGLKTRSQMKRGSSRLRAKPNPRMKEWVRQVLERDGNRCQWPKGCKTGDKRIDAHHKAKRSQRPDLKYDVRVGVALCRTHHERTDTHRDEAIALGLILEETYEKARKENAR